MSEMSFVIWISVSAVVFLLAIIVFISSFVIEAKYRKLSMIIDTEIMAILSGISITIAGISLILSITFCVDYSHEYHEHVVNIMSMSRGSSISGTFVLGTGTIKEKNYYFYYYQTDKGIKLGQIESDDTYIIETDEYEPSIYHHKTKWESDYYILYVPFDTVVTTYVLG